jgi:hypothetical protein
MDLAKNLPVQGHSVKVIVWRCRDVWAGLPKPESWFWVVLVTNNDSREGRPTVGIKMAI